MSGPNPCPKCGLSECTNAPRGPFDVLPATRRLVEAALRAEEWLAFPTQQEIRDYAATNDGRASTRQARLDALREALVEYRAAAEAERAKPVPRVSLHWRAGQGGPSTDRVEVRDQAGAVLAAGFKTLKTARFFVEEKGWEWAPHPGS